MNGVISSIQYIYVLCNIVRSDTCRAATNTYIVTHYYIFIKQRFFYSWRGWDPYSNVKTRIFFVFENWKSSISPKQGTSNTGSKNAILFTTVYFYKGIDFEIKRLKRVSAILNSVYLW